MKGGFLLNVVGSEGPAILQLLAGKDQTLLVWGNALLVLDLGLDVVDGIQGLHLKGNGLASQSLHKNLHTSPKAKHLMEGALLLDVVVSKRATILKLLTSEDKPLLVQGIPSLS